MGTDKLRARKKIVALFDRPALERLSSFNTPSHANIEALRANIVATFDGEQVAAEFCKLLKKAID